MMTNRRCRELTVKRADPSSFRECSDPTIPFHFSSTAREEGQNLQIGDYIKVRGLDNRYELMDIFPRFGSVRVREVGRTEELLIPWHLVSPWKKEVIRSETVMQAIGGWLFGRNRVYRLSEPGRILKQQKINWDRESVDVEDEDGQVFYDIPWDDLEFADDDIEFHLPEE